MGKLEFMSPAWIEMASGEITSAFQGKDLSGASFTLCEEFTNPPAHLRRGDAETIGFCISLHDGQIEVGDHPREDADCTIVSEYAEALAVARNPEMAAADPKAVQERLASGRLRILGNPGGMPAVLGQVDVHRLLASHTA